MADNLYRLLVVLRQPQGNVVLTYLGADNARRDFTAMCDQHSVAISARDDFGNEAYVMREQIASVVLTDVDRDMEGQKQIALKNARMQAKAQREAQSDPMIGGNRIMAQPNGPLPGFMRGN